jgi:hypothetical protein
LTPEEALSALLQVKPSPPKKKPARGRKKPAGGAKKKPKRSK